MYTQRSLFFSLSIFLSLFLSTSLSLFYLHSSCICLSYAPARPNASLAHQLCPPYDLTLRIRNVDFEISCYLTLSGLVLLLHSTPVCHVVIALRIRNACPLDVTLVGTFIERSKLLLQLHFANDLIYF